MKSIEQIKYTRVFALALSVSSDSFVSTHAPRRPVQTSTKIIRPVVSVKLDSILQLLTEDDRSCGLEKSIHKLFFCHA